MNEALGLDHTLDHREPALVAEGIAEFLVRHPLRPWATGEAGWDG